MKLKRCRLTEKQQGRLLEFFVGEMTARTAADLAGINKTTAAYFYHRLREIIAWRLDQASPLAGEIEADESYFGGKRKGKRGRGAAGKVPVFGILKRGGRVYTKMIPDASSATLIPIINRMIGPIASSIRTPGQATTRSTSRTFIISGSIIRNCSQTATTTSTASRISGTRRNGIYENSTAFPNTTSICSSKSANGVSTKDRPSSA